MITTLKIIKKLGPNKISFYGDSKLVIKQVKGEYQAKDHRMRAYHNAVLDILNTFLEYTLSLIPRNQNFMDDSLTTIASMFKKPIHSNKKFEINVKHHPAVPNNLRYWQVFQDDKQINNFLQIDEEFTTSYIDDVFYEDDQEIQETQLKVLQLKENFIPRSLVPLEDLLDDDDVAQKPTMVPIEAGVEDINIGTTEKPKMVKLSKSLTSEMKGKYATILVEFFDMFAWDYSDLKVYDKNIIQHTIPIKSNQNPFCQKLRRINSKVLPSIEKEVNKLYKDGIIVPLLFYDWMSNLVQVRKNTGEIHLCIDFQNLNEVSLKDNYPLPKMDHIL